MLRGRHRRRGRPQADLHRRHALGARRPGDPGDDRVSGAGDRGRDRAEDEGRPGEAPASLARLAEEDPIFQVESDEETGQTLIHGMGELHLEVIVDRLCGVQRRRQRRPPAGRVPRDDPRPGREGRGPLRAPDRRPRPVRSRRDQPRARAGARASTSSTGSGGAIPTEFIPAVEQGIEEALGSGVKAGYPMVDVRVELSTAPTTTSTPRRWPSRSPVRWRSRRPPVARSRSARARDGGRGRHARGVPRPT